MHDLDNMIELRNISMFGLVIYNVQFKVDRNNLECIFDVKTNGFLR